MKKAARLEFETVFRSVRDALLFNIDDGKRLLRRFGLTMGGPKCRKIVATDQMPRCVPHRRDIKLVPAMPHQASRKGHRRAARNNAIKIMPLRRRESRAELAADQGDPQH